MADLDFGPLFAGCDDNLALFALHRTIRSPQNDAQRTFCTVWTAVELLNGDGFEMLFEQVTTLEEYAAAFATIGMLHVAPIFDRVLALIPPDLRHPPDQQALFAHLRTKFEELKQLAYDFYDESRNFVPKIAGYVRAHRNDFSEYLGSTAIRL
jgi:hypothetical protein